MIKNTKYVIGIIVVVCAILLIYKYTNLFGKKDKKESFG